MEFDPAYVVLGAVVTLLVAIVIGGAILATWDRRRQRREEWVQELDELGNRLETMVSEMALLDAQVHQLEEIESLQSKVARLRHENEQLHQGYQELRDQIARIAVLVGRPPSRRG